jgi:DNA replication factor GINS
VDLGELQQVKDTERGKDSLQHLSDTFYTDVAAHIESLKDERTERAAQADDPFDDPEIQRLTSEIDSTEQVVKSIYERRVGKLVKLASFAAADMPANEDGLTSEERELFSDLVARIKDNRAHVLDVLAGEADTDPVGSPDGPEQTGATVRVDSAAPPEDTPTPTEGSSVSAADLMGDGSEPEPEQVPSAAGAVTDDPETPDSGSSEAPADEPADGAAPTESAGDTDDIDRTTLRITRDVGEIVGIDDREYDLAADDIVSLPEANAGALVQREAAERLD